MSMFNGIGRVAPDCIRFDIYLSDGKTRNSIKGV